MSIELQAAYHKVGGSSVVCDLCRPIHANKLPRLGLRSRDNSDHFNVKTRLDQVIQNHAQCWLCCWLLMLASSRRMKSLIKITPRDHNRVWLGFTPHVTRTFETGKTSADTYHDSRELVRMAAWIDRRELDGDFEYFVFFQTSEPKPLALSPLLDRTDFLDWPEHVPFTTRIRPPNIDMRLFQRWKQKCLTSHLHDCESTRVDPVQELRVIDVENRCIIESMEGADWVALSYCWGGPQEHALLTDNLARYYEPGALTDPILPPVILDAITVTKNMGERYLWVDSLCIIQDDEVDKVRYLSSMDSIYAHAVFTIINAAGGSVNSPVGLPGVKTSSPRRPHIPFNINDTWLSDSLDPGHGYYSGYVESTRWHERGWTFQEAILSRRCLVFTEDQVYWHCQKASWCEGSFWERDDELQIYRHFLGDNLLTSVLEPPDKDWNQVYTAVLTKYLVRQFSSESDRLHALTGLLRVLSKVIDDSFHWGLPKATMEHYLSLATTKYNCLRRTVPHKTIDSDTNMLKSCPFPSWSWLGWQGHINHVAMSVTVGTLGLKFYRLEAKSPLDAATTMMIASATTKATPKPIVDDQSVCSVETYDDIRASIRYPPDAKHDKWMDITRQDVRSAEVPTQLSSLRYANLLPSLLCFYTSTATLKIVNGAFSDYHNQFRVVLEDNNGNKTSGLFGGEKNLDLPEEGLFIVIGARRLRMSHGGDLTLHLLMLEQFLDEDLKEGLADDVVDALDLDGVVWRRKHLVTEVREAEWEKLECRKWEVVYLA